MVLLFSVSAAAQSSQPTELRIKDIKGSHLSLADYRGKVVLINFWATWCIPCRKEIPDLIKMQKEYRAYGLRVIGITYPPQQISEVRQLIRKLRINYRVALGTKATKTLFTTSDTLPMTIVIDRDGSPREVIEGILFSDEFEEKVKPLLKSQ